MMARIDAAITARVFQPIVDLAQQRIGWWGAVWALVMAAMMASRVDHNDGWIMLFVGFAALMYLLTSIACWNSDAFYAYLFGGSFMRALAYVEIVRGVLTVALSLFAGLTFWHSMIGSASFIALYFFSQCRPPRPRVPRRKPALARVG